MSYDPTAVPLRGLKNPSPFTGSLSSDYLDIAFSDTEKMSLIDFAAQHDFNSLRDKFIDYIKAVYPDDFTQFVESDLGMMFIELVAYLGSMLAYKADSLANEMFLPTVSTRNNARKLLKLIGIDMTGPIAAKASAKTTVNDLSAGDTVTISTQTVELGADADGEPLNFTLYKVDRTTGEIDLTETSITLDFQDFNEQGLTNNLALIEGQVTTQEGTFTALDRTIQLNSASIVDGSIVVSSNEDGGTIYNEISNLFLASGSEPVFEKVYQDDYSCVLLFGTGSRGKLPTDGADYLVTYTVGGGARGNIPKEFINYSVEATINRSGGASETISVTVENSGAATGGAEAETLEQVKKYAPLIFKSQYRCVTGEDYMAFVNRFVGSQGGQVKGIAVLRDAGATANVIDVYVVEKASDLQLARASNATKQELLTYLNELKMLSDEIVIVDGLVRTLDLVVQVVSDKRYKINEDLLKTKVMNSILRFFNVNNIDFGEPIRFGQLQKAVFEDVPEVQWITIENFDVDEIFVNFNEIIQLNNVEVNFRYIQ